MTTLSDLTISMKEFNRHVAPGSECTAWQDFVNDCFIEYGMMPWDDRAEEIEPSEEFISYWKSVSNSEAQDYDENGSRREN